MGPHNGHEHGHNHNDHIRGDSDLIHREDGPCWCGRDHGQAEADAINSGDLAVRRLLLVAVLEDGTGRPIGVVPVRIEPTGIPSHDAIHAIGQAWQQISAEGCQPDMPDQVTP